MKIIKDRIRVAIKKLDLPIVEFGVEHPKDEMRGDYSSNVAMIVAKQISQNPKELAEKIVDLLQKDIEVNRLISKIEVAGAGFINFYLKEEWLVKEMKNVLKEGFGSNQDLAGKKVIVEYTDPNPFKEMHIGHLMSNTIGESIAKLLEAQGAEIKRANYQGDVGLHVAKSVWGMQQKMAKLNVSLADLQGLALKERQRFMGQAYAHGADQYESDETAKVEMHELNMQIYGRTDEKVNELYDIGRTWSLEYFEMIYQRLGTKFDEYFFESEAGPVGLSVVQEGLDKGVLELGEEGAVVYKGEKDGMHTRVFRNKLGLPTYEAKDLGLAKTKWGRYKYDLSYIVTANEITEYFKVLLKVMSQLYPDLASKTTHIAHGMMKLTSGKMSSRTGKVVTAESLLNDLKDVILEKMGDREVGDKERVADEVAVGALKFGVLRQGIGGDMVYDPDKMTNLEGATGPYVQYTYARAMSVLEKAHKNSIEPKTEIKELSTEELGIMRWLLRYPEVVMDAGRVLAPQLIATYILELSSRFNVFYNKHQIVGDTKRVELTQAVSRVIASGLNLLGISAPLKM